MGSIFEAAVVLEIQDSVSVDAQKKERRVHTAYSWPDGLAPGMIANLATFAWPDLQQLHPHDTAADASSFVFVLTEGDGSKVLDEAVSTAQHTGLGTVFPLLASVGRCGTLAPGMQHYLRVSGREQALPLYCPKDGGHRVEAGDVEHILRLTPRNLLGLFANLLCERRIIFASSSLSLLSNGIATIAALTYPFEWAGVYVPVLPDTLLSFCCAPMPFVMGVLAHQLPQLEALRSSMDRVVIFDLDADAFVASEWSDLGQIPQPYKVAMVRSLEKAAAKPRVRGQSMQSMGKQLARPFLAFFVQVFWNYRRFFDDNWGWDGAAFLASKHTHATKRFLDEFVQTQMFMQFIAAYARAETSRFGTFERLTNYVVENYANALRVRSDADPRSRFKKRLSRIIPPALRKMQSGANAAGMLASSSSLVPAHAFSSARAVEIVRDSDEKTGFGLPLSKMRLARSNSGPLEPIQAQSPMSPMSPFVIRGNVSPNRSPCIFSPSSPSGQPDAHSPARSEIVPFLSRLIDVAHVEQLHEDDALEDDNNNSSSNSVDENNVHLRRDSWDDDSSSLALADELVELAAQLEAKIVC